MKTAIIFYSFGGFTKNFAKEEAVLKNADVFEVKECKKRSLLGAFFKGCPAAIKQKPVPLQGEPIDLSAYDTILVAAPVWAGFPAPAFNSIVTMLPPGKEIEIVLTSGSGKSTKCTQSVKRLVEKTGSKVTGIRDIVNKKSK